MESALDVSDMNCRAIVFNTVVVNGDVMVYPTRINYVAMYEGTKSTNTKSTQENKDVVQSSAECVAYFDALNSVGDTPFVHPKKYVPDSSWTLKGDDYILFLPLYADYPDTSSVATYADLIAFMAENDILQISSVFDVHDEVGGIIMRSVKCLV